MEGQCQDPRKELEGVDKGGGVTQVSALLLPGSVGILTLTS